MGWATDEAKRIVDGQRSLEENRRWELHVADIIKRDSPTFFEKLCDQVAGDVREFNEVHGDDDPITCEREQGRIVITRRASYPHALVELTFDPFYSQIKIRKSRQDGTLQERQESRSVIRLSIDRQSQISNEIGEISISVLRPLLDAYRSAA